VLAAVFSSFRALTLKVSASSPWFWVAAALWLTAASSGLAVLWAWDNAPGDGATAPSVWPADAGFARSHDGPTLVVLAHPQCSCTRASLDELAEALARATIQPKTYVLFLKPEGMSDDWAHSDLWRKAAALPGVTVVRDDNGAEARRFGVSTSGQTLLYDKAGALLFSGGITGARAHRGDNDGRRAIVDLLNRGSSGRAATNVFGCPLFSGGL
jgi:hypothetical protein